MRSYESKNVFVLRSFYCNMNVLHAVRLPIFCHRLSCYLTRTFRAWAYLAGFQEYNSRSDPFGKRLTSLYARWTNKARYLPHHIFCDERAMLRCRPQLPRSTHGTPGTITLYPHHPLPPPPFSDKEQFPFSDSGFPSEALLNSTNYLVKDLTTVL